MRTTASVLRCVLRAPIKKEKPLTVSHWRCIQTVSLCLLLLTGTARAQSSDAGDQAAAPAQSSPAPNQPAPAGGQSANLVTCSSQLGQRIQCAVDTSVGVALVRSRGAAPCLFGDTWGFDAAGIWVADGCSGFLVARGDTRSLATKLRLLILDDCLRTRLGSASRQRYESEFRFEHMLQRTLRVYQRVHAGRGCQHMRARRERSASRSYRPEHSGRAE